MASIIGYSFYNNTNVNYSATSSAGSAAQKEEDMVFTQEVGESSSAGSIAYTAWTVTSLINAYTRGNISIDNVIKLLVTGKIKYDKQDNGNITTFIFEFEGKKYSMSCNTAAAKKGDDDIVSTLYTEKELTEKYHLPKEAIAKYFIAASTTNGTVTKYTFNTNSGFSSLADLAAYLQNQLILQNYLGGTTENSSTTSDLKRDKNGTLISVSTTAGQMKALNALIGISPQNAEQVIDKVIKDFARGNLTTAQLKVVLGALGITPKITYSSKTKGYTVTFEFKNKTYTITCNKADAAQSNDKNNTKIYYAQDLQGLPQDVINRYFKTVSSMMGPDGKVIPTFYIPNDGVSVEIVQNKDGTKSINISQDTNNSTVTKITVSSAKAQTLEQEYSETKNGKTEKQVDKFDQDGQITSTTIETRDENGNVTAKTEFEYLYDYAKGTVTITEKKYGIPDNQEQAQTRSMAAAQMRLLEMTVRTVSISDLENKLANRQRPQDTDALDRNMEKLFDEISNGKVTEQYQYDEKGNKVSTTIITHFDASKEVVYTKLDADGNVLSVKSAAVNLKSDSKYDNILNIEITSNEYDPSAYPDLKLKQTVTTEHKVNMRTGKPIATVITTRDAEGNIISVKEISYKESKYSDKTSVTIKEWNPQNPTKDYDTDNEIPYSMEQFDIDSTEIDTLMERLTTGQAATESEYESIEQILNQNVESSYKVFYDENGNVIGETNSKYQYDDDGNLKNETGSYKTTDGQEMEYTVEYDNKDATKAFPATIKVNFYDANGKVAGTVTVKLNRLTGMVEIEIKFNDNSTTNGKISIEELNKKGWSNILNELLSNNQTSNPAYAPGKNGNTPQNNNVNMLGTLLKDLFSKFE